MSNDSFNVLTLDLGPSTYKSPIVVVNSRGSAGNPEDDENLKKLKEIPRFYPILKGVLPGQRDPPSVFSKIDPRYLLRFTHRLQEHFTICHQTISSEQNSLFAKISDVSFRDGFISLNSLI